MGEVISIAREDLQSALVRERLAPLGHEFIAEAGYPEPFEPVHFFNFWSTILATDTGKFLVVEEDGVPVGVMGCLFVRDTFTGVMTGMEHFWFVSKSARRGARIGLSMFEEFERECDRRKCRFKLMIHLDGLRGEALAGFYKRRGYLPAERCYRKVI